METLPFEIVEMVCQYLYPEDLAHCCAVSPCWREIFDQDCLWKPFCDLALEEPLRTIPSIVEPVFVSPEVENSTLPSISKWRLALIREHHLWVHWLGRNRKCVEDSVLEMFNETTLKINPFLSDTLIVNWHKKTFEIWDVSVIPATLVAETDSSVDIENWSFCGVLGNNMVFVENPTYIQVFHVDAVNKSIKLKNVIFLEISDIQHDKSPIFVDGSIHGVRATKDSHLTMIDFEKGTKIVEVPCPVMNKYKIVRISGISSSPTSDDVLVAISDERNISYYYIFSLKQQRYLPGPIAEKPEFSSDAINSHYVALGGLPSLTIIDYHTSEVLFENKGQEFHIKPQVYNDGFIFLESSYWGYINCQVKMFSLQNKTLTTIYERRRFNLEYELKIVNNRFANLYRDDYSLATFDLDEEQTGDNHFVEGSTLFPDRYRVVNRSFTRSTYVCRDGVGVDIYYHW